MKKLFLLLIIITGCTQINTPEEPLKIDVFNSAGYLAFKSNTEIFLEDVYIYGYRLPDVDNPGAGKIEYQEIYNTLINEGKVYQAKFKLDSNYYHVEFGYVKNGEQSKYKTGINL